MNSYINCNSVRWTLVVIIFLSNCTTSFYCYSFKTSGGDGSNMGDIMSSTITSNMPNISSSIESWLNFTYNSRLLYRMKNQLNLVSENNSPISHRCLSVLRVLLNETVKQQWSLEMLDANAPTPSSLLTDQLTSIGGYEQCLAIEGAHREIKFKGQYCLLDMKVREELNFTPGSSTQMESFFKRLQYINKRYPLLLGLCIPSTCSAADMNYLLDNYVSEFPMNLVNAKVGHCQNSDKLFPNQSLLNFLRENNLIVVISILGTAVICVLIGTIMDIFSTNVNPNSNIGPILLCFSLIRNTRILLGSNKQSTHFVLRNDTDTSLQSKPALLTANSLMVDKTNLISQNVIEKRFVFLHGVRSLFITWILVAHSVTLIPASIIMPVSFLANHPHSMIQLHNENQLMRNFFNNGTLAVEAFFFISGLLLVAITISRRLYAKVNFAQFVIIRWLRFAPPLLGIIVFQKCATLLGRGPFFTSSILNETILKTCSDNQWWKSFLFIQNWDNLADTCIPISWFLSADFQIHIIAFGMMLCLRKKLIHTLFAYCIFWILFSIILPIAMVLNGLPTFTNLDLFANFERYSLNSYILLYSGTHIHLGAYFFGALLGYFITRPKLLITNQLIQSVSWWCSLTFLLIGPCLNTPDVKSGHLYKTFGIGTLHTVWVFALAVIFYQLSLVDTPKHVRGLKRILCASLFGPMSRLSFCLYLSHMTIIWYNVYSLKAPFEVNTINITFFAAGVFIESIILAYIIFILFECPSVNLLKLIFDLNKLINSNVDNDDDDDIGVDDEDDGDDDDIDVHQNSNVKKLQKEALYQLVCHHHHHVNDVTKDGVGKSEHHHHHQQDLPFLALTMPHIPAAILIQQTEDTNNNNVDVSSDGSDSSSSSSSCSSSKPINKV